MESQDGVSRGTVLSFAVAVGILIALLYVVGIDDILAAMSATEPMVLLVISITVFAWIGVWSGSLYLTSTVFDVETTIPNAVLVYAHLMFLDNVIPFSSISADPLAALAVSRATDADYETSLATVITVDFLNFLPAPAFGTFGLVYLVATVPFDETITTLAVSLILLLVGLSAVGYLSWHYRHRIVAFGSVATVVVLRAVSSVLPRISPPSRAEVTRRADALITDLETMAADRKSLLIVATLATIGWGLLGATLWLSLYSIGHAIPIGLALFLVSLVTVGELVPLPGGVGSSESLFVVLLVALSEVPLADATAGILIHRGATYWFPVILGGGVIPFVFRNRLNR